MIETFYVVKTEFSNGFPYPEFTACKSLKIAEKKYCEVKFPIILGPEANIESGTGKWCWPGWVKYTHYTEDSQKGNGCFIGIITKSRILEAIRYRLDYTPGHVINNLSGREIEFNGIPCHLTSIAKHTSGDYEAHMTDGNLNYCCIISKEMKDNMLIELLNELYI